MGVYPSASLSDARREAEKARSCISNGINPSNKRKEEKTFKNIELESESRRDAGLPITNSFADLTRKWLASIAHLTSVITQIKKTSRLERLVFPVLGDILDSKLALPVTAPTFIMVPVLVVLCTSHCFL